jgi:hypothetical protein
MKETVLTSPVRNTLGRRSDKSMDARGARGAVIIQHCHDLFMVANYGCRSGSSGVGVIIHHNVHRSRAAIYRARIYQMVDRGSHLSLLRSGSGIRVWRHIMLSPLPSWCTLKLLRRCTSICQVVPIISISAAVRSEENQPPLSI